MIDLTHRFIRVIQYVPSSSNEAPEHPKILELLKTLRGELDNLDRAVQVQRASFCGDALANTSRQTMTFVQCLQFEQRLYQAASGIQQQLLELIRTLDKQLSAEPTGTLEDRLAQLDAIEKSRLHLRLWLGAFQCLNQRAEKFKLDLAQLRHERSKFVPEPQMDFVPHRRPIKFEEPIEKQPYANTAQEKSEEEPQHELPKYWQTNRKMLKEEAMEEFFLAQKTLKTTLEIQQMQDLQALQLVQQTDQINRIAEMTTGAGDNLDRANKLLARAKRNLRASTKTTVVLLILSIFGIIFLDVSRNEKTLLRINSQTQRMQPYQPFNTSSTLGTFTSNIPSNSTVYSSAVQPTALDRWNQRQAASKPLEQQHLDIMQKELSALRTDLATVAENSQQAIMQSKQLTADQVNLQLQQFSLRIEKLQTLVNSCTTKFDALASREQLRDNITQVHERALTNFSHLTQRLETRLAEVEAQLSHKQELEIRVRNLEHDVETLFEQIQTKFQEVAKETNQNIGSIANLLQLFEEKQKGIEKQLESVKGLLIK